MDTQLKSVSKGARSSYDMDIAKYIVECNTLLKPQEKEISLLISKNQSSLSKIFKKAEDFKKSISKNYLKKFVSLKDINELISKIISKGLPIEAMFTSYDINVAEYCMENASALKKSPTMVKSLVHAVNLKLKHKFGPKSEDFKRKVSEEYLKSITTMEKFQKFLELISLPGKTMVDVSESNIPMAPSVPKSLSKFSKEDTEYAKSIANIIINCNIYLKKFKNDKQQIVDAILNCKDIKFFKKEYKNSFDFLEKVDIDRFHDDKKPADVTKSLNQIIFESTKKNSEKTVKNDNYMENARIILERPSSGFKNIARSLNDILDFIQENKKMISKKYKKFEDLLKAKTEAKQEFLDELKENAGNARSFEKEFIKYFNYHHHIKLKKVNTK